VEVETKPSSRRDIPEDKPHDKRLVNELIQILFHQSRTALIGISLSATGVAFIFKNTFSDQLVFGWLAFVYVLSATRYLFLKTFQRTKYKYSNLSGWGKIFTLMTFLSGCTWGAASIMFFTPDNLQLLMLLTIILMLMGIASLPALSSHLPAFYAYAIPIMLPVVVQYFMLGDKNYYIFGLLLLVLVTVLFAFVSVTHRILRKSILLRFENIDLIQQLKIEKDNVEQSKNEAEKANSAKTKFLAAASHDLRQPLHAIELFIGLLEGNVQQAYQKTIIGKLKKSSRALDGLLETLLDISKLDAGAIPVETSPFAIQDVFDSLWHEFEYYAKTKNLSLKFVPTRLWVNSDHRLVERILRNLLTNAIRYTNKGGVIIGCRRRQDKVLLAVYDSGIGIAKDKIDDIFLEFQQLHNPERDRSKGLGLGLAIVRRMAKLLDAGIYKKSIPGNGSIFAIELPQARAERSKPSSHKPWEEYEVLSDKTILIIDDEEDIREGLRELLLSWNCQVIAAASGTEAMELLAKNSLKPDLILADYRLRDNETGVDVIQTVQQQLGSPIAAVIITGDTAPDRIKEAKSSGYSLLHKPVTASKLRELMNYLLYKN